MNRPPAVSAARSAPHPLIRFAKTPKGCVMIALMALTLAAGLLRPQDHAGIVNAAVAVAAALAVDGGVSALMKRRKLVSDGGVITGLIVADVLSHATPFYLVALITAVALMSKHILKAGRKPLFNPAAFGLLFAIAVFSTGQSWWGSLALLPVWFAPVLVGAGLLVAARVNRLPQVIAFLGTYFGLLLAMAVLHLGLPYDTPGDALRTPFVNSALYLAFFMLTDPPTTPSPYGRQVLFGIIAAGIGTVVFALFGGLAYLLIGLLAGNAWKALLSRARKPAARSLPAAPAREA